MQFKNSMSRYRWLVDYVALCMKYVYFCEVYGRWQRILEIHMRSEEELSSSEKRELLDQTAKISLNRKKSLRTIFHRWALELVGHSFSDWVDEVEALIIRGEMMPPPPRIDEFKASKKIVLYRDLKGGGKS